MLEAGLLVGSSPPARFPIGKAVVRNAAPPGMFPVIVAAGMDAGRDVLVTAITDGNVPGRRLARGIPVTLVPVI
jgi:hypothetical protein